jgi:hypothetical protein
MKTKLENLLSFTDFTGNYNSQQATKTKRTDTGVDVIKENNEENIEDNIEDKDYSTEFDSELEKD